MRLRSLLPGLILGAVAFGMMPGQAKAQYQWQDFRTDTNWLLLDNWNLNTFPGDTNSSVAGVAEGTAADTALIGARAFAGPIGINFAAGGGDGNQFSTGAAAARGRLTLAAFGYANIGSGTLGTLTVGNSATGTAAGEFNGILQLNGGLVNGVANTVLSNTSGQMLTIARNVGAGDPSFADMAIRINSTTANVIQLSGNSTINLQTQLVMQTAVDRRITVQGAGTVILGADNTQSYTAITTGTTTTTFVGLQGGWTLANGGILRVGGNPLVNGNANLGIVPAAVAADYFQMANGTLRADASFTLDSSRGITLTTDNQAGTLHVEGAANTLTYDGFITGAGDLRKNGAGTVLLSQQQTYTGDTVVNAGLLQTTGTGRLPNGTFVSMTGGQPGTILDVTNNVPVFGGLGGGNGGAGSEVRVGAATLTIDTAVTNPTAFRGAIVGSGGLIKTGVGTTILANVQPYTGGTTVSAGTLQLGDGTSTGTIIGGVLNNGNLAFSPGVTGDTNFEDVISGTGTVTKLGANVQTLSGANTYQGATFITGGTLAITSDGNLGTAPALTPGHLVLNGTTAAPASLRADASFALNANRGIALGTTGTAGVGTINVAPTFTLTYGGVMDDNGGTGSFVKAGGGELHLSSAQAYAGSTTVADGRLFMTGTGPNQLPGGTALTIGTTGAPILDLNGNNQSIGNLSGGAAGIGQVLIGGSTLTVNQSTALTYAGIIAGAGGSLVKDGAASLTLSGANTFTGPITINAGTLQIGAGATGSIDGTQAITNAGTLAFNQNIAQTASGVISGGGALTKAGTGILTLSGNNTYTGATTVTAGTLRAGSATAFGNGSNFTVNGGTVHLDGNSVSIGTLAGTGGVVENNNATAATLTLNQGANTTYAGVIANGAAGTLALTKAGTGTLILSGANTFTGPIAINAGTLQVGVGATGLIAGTQAITNDGTLAFNQNIAQTVSGQISGAGALTKAGTGILTLSGANTYAGPTTINGGTVTLSGGADRLPATTTVTLANAAANLNLNGQAQSLVALTGGGTAGGNVQLGGATGILTLNQAANQTYSGAISGGGSVVKNGANTLILDGANTFTGGLTIGAGTVQVGTGVATGSLAAALPITNNSSLVINKDNALTLSGAITGTGSLTKAGTGTLILSGANNAGYSGGTTINGGTVQIGAAGALPDTGTVTIGGGTLSTAGGTGGAGISETAGTLRTTGSTIALGTGVHTLTFNGLAPASELTGSPVITGWAGPLESPGTQGRIVFLTLADAPSAYQAWLDNVSFAGAEDPTGGMFIAAQGGGFELVPVPEPGTVLGIAAAGLAGLRLIRRRLRRDAGATVAA